MSCSRRRRSTATSRGQRRSQGSSGPSGLAVSAEADDHVGGDGAPAAEGRGIARCPPRSPHVLRAPEPTQPSNSRAARSIQRAARPRADHHRRAAEHGGPDRPDLRAADRARPPRASASWRATGRAAGSAPRSPRPARRSRPRSSRRRRRRAAGCRWRGCVVSTWRARATGCRSGTWSTPVPSSTRRVTGGRDGEGDERVGGMNAAADRVERPDAVEAGGLDVARGVGERVAGERPAVAEIVGQRHPQSHEWPRAFAGG